MHNASSAHTMENPAEPLLFTPEYKQSLETDGFVVIPNIVPDDICDAAAANLIESYKLWDEDLCVDNPSYWLQKNRPAGDVHGITRIFGHRQGQWDIRQHPRVARAFAEYWRVNPDELLTSMDAFNFYNSNFTPRGGRVGSYWCHTDLAAGSTGEVARCAQGYVTLIDSMGPNDGTLVVWAKGHRIHKRYFELHPEEAKKSKDNWYRFPEEFMQRMELDCREYLSDDDPEKNSPTPVPAKRTCVHAPKGALVLWRSATPHMNRPPVKVDGQPDPHHRLVVYVCQAPRKYATPKDFELRKRAWETQMQMSHWPGFKRSKIFPKYPRMYTEENATKLKPKIDKVYKRIMEDKQKLVLTKLGRSLLGV